MTVITEDQLEKAQPRQDAPGWGEPEALLAANVFGVLAVIAAVLVVVLIGIGII